MEIRPCSRKRTASAGCLSLLLLGLLVISASALSNLGLPRASRVVDRLSEQEKALLAEVEHLRLSTGERVWPGFGEADIPIIVFNETYAFLTGYPDPPEGWVKVPQEEPRGVEWEQVPDDSFAGQVYYRQVLPEGGVTPEAFTVMVGNRWAAALQTKEWLEIELVSMFRSELPPLFSGLVPYRLITPLFVRGSEGYITALVHESFHAFQGMVGAGRLEAAELALQKQESAYPWEDPDFAAEWQAELDMLADALQEDDPQQAAALARRFIEHRSNRRQTANLAPAVVDYERQREWLEGLARYAELSSWSEGSTASAYQPSAEAESLPDFRSYTTFPNRWKQEVDQVRRMAKGDGDGRFYYSGMAQAFLLDQFSQDWKSQALEPGIYLEDLLADALQSLP